MLDVRRLVVERSAARGSAMVRAGDARLDCRHSINLIRRRVRACSTFKYARATLKDAERGDFEMCFPDMKDCQRMSEITDIAYEMKSPRRGSEAGKEVPQTHSGRTPQSVQGPSVVLQIEHEYVYHRRDGRDEGVSVLCRADQSRGDQVPLLRLGVEHRKTCSSRAGPSRTSHRNDPPDSQPSCPGS